MPFQLHSLVRLDVFGYTPCRKSHRPAPDEPDADVQTDTLQKDFYAPF